MPDLVLHLDSQHLLRKPRRAYAACSFLKAYNLTKYLALLVIFPSFWFLFVPRSLTLGARNKCRISFIASTAFPFASYFNATQRNSKFHNLQPTCMTCTNTLFYYQGSSPSS